MKKVIVLLVFSIPLAARYHTVTSSQEFERLSDGYNYSIACFAPSSEEKGEDLSSEDRKEIQKNYKELKDMLQAAATKHQFKKFLPKDIGFILVDARSKRSQDIIKDYAIDDMPICYAFNQGKIEKNYKVINPDSTKDIIDLLEKVGGQDLQNLLRDRKEEHSQQREEEIARYYAYGGYYPYGWGYGWGGSSYWARPYYGWDGFGN